MLELKGETPDMNGIFSKVYDELRQVPITLMFMFGIYIAVGILWSDHVSKKDFAELKEQLVGVQYTLRRDHADSRLHSIEQEMFNLTQHINDERAKGHSVDELYDRRIDDLKGQHEEVMREITRLDQLSRLDYRP